MRGVGGGFASGGVDGHDEPEDLAPESGGLAAQKKSRQVASERDEGLRGLWRWLASRFFDARRLVFVDESGLHTFAMMRLRARAPRGKRAYYGRVPRNRGKNQTLIASVTLEGGIGEAISIEGATDAEVFEAYYVQDFLAPPTLKAGQEVVVLDGLGAHRTARVRE